MSNMSYCRFRNTLADLKDCDQALADGVYDRDELSPEEKRACEQLIKLCRRLGEDWMIP